MRSLIPAYGRLSVFVLSLIAAVVAAAEREPADPEAARAAFDRLKALAGVWTGTISDAKGPPATVEYRVTAGGHAVEERLFPGSPHEMVTMYHLEGGVLVGQHYCAAGNRPRFQLVAARAEALEFGFESLPGGDAAVEGHIHDGVIRLRGPAELEASWRFFSEGKPAGENRFLLRRVPTPTAPAS